MRAYRNGEGVVKAPTYEKHMQHNLFTMFFGLLAGVSLLKYRSLSPGQRYRVMKEGWRDGELTWASLKPLLEQYGVDGEDRNIDRGRD